MPLHDGDAIAWCGIVFVSSEMVHSPRGESLFHSSFDHGDQHKIRTEESKFQISLHVQAKLKLERIERYPPELVDFE